MRHSQAKTKALRQHGKTHRPNSRVQQSQVARQTKEFRVSKASQAVRLHQPQKAVRAGHLRVAQAEHQKVGRVDERKNHQHSHK